MGQVQAPVSWLLVPWDVDHTLIENNGVNKETYAKAFELLTGRHAEHKAETDGRTEPEIMQNMLIAHGIEPTDDYRARMVEALEAATSANVSRLRDRGHELPGARDALPQLDLSLALDALQRDGPRLGEGRGVFVGHADGHRRQRNPG